MVLLQGPLLTWCTTYIQQHNTRGRLQSPSLDGDSVVDYVKANFALPSEISVVRSLQRQVHCSRRAGALVGAACGSIARENRVNARVLSVWQA